MIKRKLWTWLKNGDECSVAMMLNTWRWFLPLGYEGRSHSVLTESGRIQKRTSIGFLCFMIIYTRFNKLSPYTQSLHKEQKKCEK